MEALVQTARTITLDPDGILISGPASHFKLVSRPWVKVDGKLVEFSNWQFDGARFKSRADDLLAILKFDFLNTGLKYRMQVFAGGVRRWELITPLESKIVLSPETVLWYNGPHSWSEAKVLKVDELLPDLVGHEKILGAPLMEPLPENQSKRYYHSSMLGAAYDPEAEEAFLVGILDAEKFGRVHLSPGDLQKNEYRLTVSAELDGILAKEVDSGWWYLNVDEPKAKLFIDYAKIFSRLVPSKKSPAIQGWCSWYYHYQKVTEEDVLQAVRAIKTGKWPLKVVQIDDGYQKAVGDWLETNEKFPHGLLCLARRIKKAGLIPGIWLAPFMADETSRVFRENPNWFVRNPETGEPIFQEIWEKKQYSLDTTCPEVQEWLKKLSAAFYKMGFEYLKLDFLYAASLPGKRFDQSFTTAKALRLGLKAIRKGASNAYIVGCGCPLAPAKGIVDAMRIGPDVTPSWKPSEFYGAWPAIRNSYARWFMRYWWQNDPDVMIIRDFQNPLEDFPNDLTLNQIEALACSLKDCGKFIFTSDPLEKLSESRAKILRGLLEEAGRQRKIWKPKNPFEVPFPGASRIEKVLLKK